MVTQKPISLKIDQELLEMLDAEVKLGWRKRNWHINQAIRIYLELLDLNRRLNCHYDENLKKSELNLFLRHHVPNGAEW